MSFNEIMVGHGGAPVGSMTHEEAKPVVMAMMRAHLGLDEDEPFEINEQDFTDAVNAMPMAEYALKRKAIAAFRLKGP